MGSWAGRYLVAGAPTARPEGRAVYRIDADDGATLTLTILAGAPAGAGRVALRGRRVRVARSNVAANIALGHEALVEAQPAWVGAGLLDGVGGGEGEGDGDQGGEPAGAGGDDAGGG